MPNTYLDHLQGPAGETWQQALDRFASFCLSLHAFTEHGETYEVLFDEFYRDGTLFEWSDPVTEADLRNAETRNGVVIPPTLKALYQKRFIIYDVHTEFGRWGERRVLEVYAPSSSTSYTCLHALCRALAWNFGKYFAKEALSAEQIAHLDATYFCFGRWSDDDHKGRYLLVDRQGGFGRYDFHCEDQPGSLQGLEPLLRGSPLTMTLDDVMAEAIDNAMAYLLRRNDVPGPHDEAL